MDRRIDAQTDSRIPWQTNRWTVLVNLNSYSNYAIRGLGTLTTYYTPHYPTFCVPFGAEKRLRAERTSYKKSHFVFCGTNENVARQDNKALTKQKLIENNNVCWMQAGTLAYSNLWLHGFAGRVYVAWTRTHSKFSISWLFILSQISYLNFQYHKAFIVHPPSQFSNEVKKKSHASRKNFFIVINLDLRRTPPKTVLYKFQWINYLVENRNNILNHRVGQVLTICKLECLIRMVAKHWMARSQSARTLRILFIY